MTDAAPEDRAPVPTLPSDKPYNTHDAAMEYLAQPEFRNRLDPFLVNALVRKFGLGYAWARARVWEHRKKEAFGEAEA